MGLIRDMIPTNLQAEREKFLAADGDYNPQFQYQREFKPTTLEFYGLPRQKYYEQAVKYLAKEAKIANETAPGKAVTRERVQERLDEVCQELGIASMSVITNPNQSSGFFLTPRRQLSARLPIEVSEKRLEAVLNHEIQTHLLRTMNDKIQPWHQQKRSKRLWKRTEEGLAIYNGNRHLRRPILQKIAVYYELIYLSQTRGFAELYPVARQRLGSIEKAFLALVRVKRGLRDTSLPGGFTKDMVYWEGYQQVSVWLAEPGHQMKDLYWGKIGLEEVEQLRGQAQLTGLILPTFLR